MRFFGFFFYGIKSASGPDTAYTVNFFLILMEIYPCLFVISILNPVERRYMASRYGIKYLKI